MPATSSKQRKFACAEMGRKERGEATKSGMSMAQLKDYCKLKVKK